MTIQEIKQLVEDYPNDQDLGGKVRELYWKDYKNGTYSFISSQLNLFDSKEEEDKRDDAVLGYD
tara:strand:- start:3620 stop:3811 length:192 start_codon:yes stop_codon:yes gene_type:complete